MSEIAAYIKSLERDNKKLREDFNEIVEINERLEKFADMLEGRIFCPLCGCQIEVKNRERK